MSEPENKAPSELTVRLNFNCSRQLRDRLRTAAALESARQGHVVTMSDLMLSVLEEALNRFEEQEKTSVRRNQPKG